MVSEQDAYSNLDLSLLETARAYLPYLEGMRARAEPLITPHYSDEVLPLIAALKHGHPEAGVGYWRSRAWALLGWQPIYLAMICVYHFQRVPSALAQLEQRQVEHSVAGFYLPSQSWSHRDSVEQCIVSAGKALTGLFDAHELSLRTYIGGRKAYYQALLADQVILILEHVATLIPDSGPHWVSTQYEHWRHAMALPKVPQARFWMANNQRYLRRTCCLQFRCTAQDVCENCPKTLSRQPPLKQLS